MKHFIIAVYTLLASTIIVQGQTGVPAKIKAVNGKEFPAYLQGINGGNITFNLHGRSKVQAVPAKLIAELNFVSPLDADGVNQLFVSGDYQAMIDKMDRELMPSLQDYWQYMGIANNLQNVFVDLMNAYLWMGNIPKARESAEVMLKNGDAAVKAAALGVAVNAFLSEDNLEKAQSLLEQVDSEPGRLYLQACIHRANGEPQEAIKLVDDVIANYANDLAWMPQSELLDAYLYMDLGLTNSAINTARQVESIYTDTGISGIAKKLQSELHESVKRAEAAAEAKKAEEAAERERVKARAQERAKGVGFGASEESEDID